MTAGNTLYHNFMRNMFTGHKLDILCCIQRIGDRIKGLLQGHACIRVV